MLILRASLTLPVPLSPNRWKSNGFARQAQKDEYRRAAWIAAIQQEKPFRDPPARVRVLAHLYTTRPRDDDNLKASMKDVLDTLRQKQTGAMRWREGLYTECGFCVDDGPDQLALEVWQTRVKQRKSERLELVIWEIDDAAPREGGET